MIEEKITKLKEDCPNCKREKLELKPACCADRQKGIQIVKRCSRCGYKEVFL